MLDQFINFWRPWDIRSRFMPVMSISPSVGRWCGCLCLYRRYLQAPVFFLISKALPGFCVYLVVSDDDTRNNGLAAFLSWRLVVADYRQDNPCPDTGCSHGDYNYLRLQNRSNGKKRSPPLHIMPCSDRRSWIFWRTIGF